MLSEEGGGIVSYLMKETGARSEKELRDSLAQMRL
jgi:hypothetical protein